jgi:hypothetical protein
VYYHCLMSSPRLLRASQLGGDDASASARSSLASASSDTAAGAPSGRSQSLLRALSCLVIGLLNVAVVAAANAGFVYVSVYNGSKYILFAVQVGLAMFKYVWNSKALWTIVNRVLSSPTASTIFSLRPRK